MGSLFIGPARSVHSSIEQRGNMRLRSLIWLVGTVLMLVAAAAANSKDASYQYLCVGDFSCYGSAVKYSVALSQSTECSFDTFGYNGLNTGGSYSFGGTPFSVSFPITVNISIDWREQASSTAKTSEPPLQFDYEYVAINFTSSAVISNILQVQPSAVDDSQSTSSYFTLDETWQGLQRVDIFHAYQYGRRQAQPGVVYWPVMLVQLVTRNATWDEELVSTWDPTTWDALMFSCDCQLWPWFDRDDDTSCNDLRYCHLSPFYLDQQGVCSAQQTHAVPILSEASQTKFRVISGLLLLAGVCWYALLFCRGKRETLSNPMLMRAIPPNSP
jgi:hypothetical protein